MTTFLAIALLVVGVGATEDDGKADTPNGAVAVMQSRLAAKQFKAFYNLHCHKHLRDQIGEEDFVEFMNGQGGTAVASLFREVRLAIQQRQGEEVLIARPQDDPDEYEFILVQVKKGHSRKGQLWHLELKQEDGRWKLKDTD